MIHAVWNNQEIAKSENTIIIEGNHYFPKVDVLLPYLQDSETQSRCPWKGLASYYSLVVDGKVNKDAAWYYPDPSKKATEIKDYVAFWNGVDVYED